MPDDLIEAPPPEAPMLRQVADIFRGTPEVVTALAGHAGRLTARVMVRIAVRIAFGARIVGARWQAWAREDTGLCIVVTLAVVGISYLARAELVPLEAGGFVLVSLMIGGGVNDGQDHREGAPPPAPKESDPRDFARHVEYAVAVAASKGRKGIHLADLLTELHAAGVAHGLDDAAKLRDRLAGLRLPVRDQLKIGGVNRNGVRVDDLHRHLGRAPHLPPHLVPDLTREEGAPLPAPSPLPSPDSEEDAEEG